MATARNRFTAGGLLLPYIAIIVALLIVPAIDLVEISFRTQSATRITGTGLTWANYRQLTQPFYIKIFLDTLRFSLLAGAIAAVFGYPLAYLFARSSGFHRTLLSLTLMIPLMTSVVVKVFGWYIILEPDGMINNILAAFGLGRANLIHNGFAVMIGLVEFSLPFMVFCVAASIERIPRDVEEAAANLGATGFDVLLRVLLPLSRGGLMSGFLLCVGVAASAYVVPAILGGTRVRMAAQQIYDDVLVGFNWPGAAAFSIALVLMLGLIFYIATRFEWR